MGDSSLEFTMRGCARTRKIFIFDKATEGNILHIVYIHILYIKDSSVVTMVLGHFNLSEVSPAHACSSPTGLCPYKRTTKFLQTRTYLSPKEDIFDPLGQENVLFC